MRASSVLLAISTVLVTSEVDVRGEERAADVALGRVLSGSPIHVTDDIAIDPGGTLLVSAGWAGDIELWDLRSGRHVVKLLAHDAAYWTSVSFSAGGNVLASCSSDGAVKLWNVTTGELCEVLQHNKAVTDVAFSPDGTQLIAAQVDGIVRIWDKRPCIPSRSIETGQELGSISISPNGRILATVDTWDSVKLWDLKTGLLKSALEGAKGINTEVTFSSDGQFLFAATSWHSNQTDMITIWSVATGEVRTAFPSVAPSAVPLALSPRGDLIAVGGLATVYLLDSKTGEQIATLPNGDGFVEDIAFFPNGRRIAVGGRDGQIRIWSIGTISARQRTTSRLGDPVGK